MSSAIDSMVAPPAASMMMALRILRSASRFILPAGQPDPTVASLADSILANTRALQN
jgi:hypothetical protein